MSICSVYQEAHPRLHLALQRVQQALQNNALTESLRDTEWVAYIWLSTNALAMHKPHQEHLSHLLPRP
jgi:hypothetical protein